MEILKSISVHYCPLLSVHLVHFLLRSNYLKVIIFQNTERIFMSIQAIFWDYDNTILESADAHWNKHFNVLGRKGIQLDEKHRKRIYENNGNQNWIWMKDELGLNTPEKEYLQEIDHEFHQQMCSLKFRPGVQELFELFNDLEIPQAIITNARRDSAEPVLRDKKLLGWMKFVLYKEDYEGRKPDPDPYLKGLRLMSEYLGHELDPKKCLAIEDDPKGVESASRAGLIVVQRKLTLKESDSKFAHHSCYQSNEFVEIVKTIVF